jgi:hypothetical protein
MLARWKAALAAVAVGSGLACMALAQGPGTPAPATDAGNAAAPVPLPSIPPLLNSNGTTAPMPATPPATAPADSASPSAAPATPFPASTAPAMLPAQASPATPFAPAATTSPVVNPTPSASPYGAPPPVTPATPLPAATPLSGAPSPLPAADPAHPAWRHMSNADLSPIAPGAFPTTGTPAPLPAANAGNTPPLSNAVTHAPVTRVTNGNGTLPNDHGQVWREYDISPYTLRVTTTNHPEQSIVDWILRETGYEAWHSEPLGILAADHRTLRVYHTPQMQAVVAEMVDRFVSSDAATQDFGVRVLGVGTPSWRAKYQRILKPIPVQSQGVQAWLLAKEDASLLLADLRKRSDMREYNSPHLLVANGQSAVVSTMRPHSYASGVTLHPEQAQPGFEPQMSQFEDGFSLELDPLLALDGRSIDAMIKCHIDQLEKMVPVTIDVPTALNPRQHTDIQVPQWASYRVHERFHWPADQVLLVSLGIVAAPAASDGGLKLPFSPAARSELLVFVGHRGAGGTPPTAPPQVVAPSTAQRPAAPTYQGRY